MKLKLLPLLLMKKLIIFLTSFIPLLIITAGIPVSSKLSHLKANSYSTTKVEIKTFRNDYKPLLFSIPSTKKDKESWGYDVYFHGVLYVHQPFFSGSGNNQGFRKEEDALKSARLAIHKIRNKISPFNITLLELDSLGVVK